MRILVYRKYEFEIYNTEGSLVVVNTKGSYENHAHLTRHTDSKGKIKLDTAKTLISIMLRRKIPKSSYLITSAIRLTVDQEYRYALETALARRKSKKYVNVNKGVRKWLNFR